jgi:hypothetical protein
MSSPAQLLPGTLDLPGSAPRWGLYTCVKSGSGQDLSK